MIILVFCLQLFSSPSFAAPIEVHKKAMRDFIQRTDLYEKQLEELRLKKIKTQDGPAMEEMVNEIADIHKKLLSIRHEKNLLNDHLKKDHPREDLMSDLTLMRPVDKDPKKNPLLPPGKKPDKSDVLDQRLDGLIKQIQSQYVRTAKDREVFDVPAETGKDPLVIDLSTDKKKKPAKKEILQEDKDTYLKENLKTKIKVGD